MDVFFKYRQSGEVIPTPQGTQSAVVDFLGDFPPRLETSPQTNT